MWVAYFLPQWLSKHEDSSGRAIERYKNAMQVVGENNGSIKSEESIEDKGKIFFKRRLIFGSMFSLFAISSIYAGIGFLDWTTTLVPASALLIYLVSVRKQVMASQLKIRRLRALEKITNSKIPTTLIPEPVLDMRSKKDLDGNPLKVTFQAVVDNLATIANVVVRIV